MTELAIGLILFLLVGIITLLSTILYKLRTDKREGFQKLLNDGFQGLRDEFRKNERALREEVNVSQTSARDSMIKTISRLGSTQGEHLSHITKQVQALMETNIAQLGTFGQKVDDQLKELRESNEKKLEEMRCTVDEKLQGTLERRLGESFKLVSDQLEAVQRGLGEMQNLATGVGDLKRVLTNVKARGTWGEIQLGSILEEILTPDQYGTNVSPNPNSRETVEYAIRLPGKDAQNPIYLPIDSKFPQEDYLRLVEASENGDPDAVEKASTGLVRAIRKAAKDISEKYIVQPYTTDFAIMFLPTEGLYAEVLRQPGKLETLQQDYRVVVAGPTTFSAILNSLRMGFRTLAIEKRSSEVWEILGAVKTEFGKFSEVLTKVQKQLATASRTLESTGVRTRAMERRLREVEALPLDESSNIIGLLDAEHDDIQGTLRLGS